MPTDGLGSDAPPRFPEKLAVAGTPISPVGLTETLDFARDAIASRRPLSIAVTNANKCWIAQRDPGLLDFMHRAELVVSETSTVWASRRLGLEGVGHVWGVDLMARLLSEVSSLGGSVFLLGARPEVLSRLVERCAEEWPGVRIVGARDGYYPPDEEAEVVELVTEARPDLLLVAMGSPRQERFMARLPQESGPVVRLGVGGSFDVHSGLVPDAPAWVRGSGFEWLYRALRSPRLFRRYAVVNPWFVTRVMRDAWFGERA